MKYLNYIIVTVLFALTVACSPMDDSYKQFTENGPITYLTKVVSDSVEVNSGRNRVKLNLPKSADPRWKKAVVYWGSRLYKDSVDINAAGKTELYINNLAEGSYIFEIIIFDELGNYSIPTTVTGEVYGDNYERYLINRPVKGVTKSGTNVSVNFADIVDKTIVRTEISWKVNGTEYSATVDTNQTVGTLENFDALSFRYRTVYIPGIKGLDEFYSAYAYYVENIEPAQVTVNTSTKKFTFPAITDNYWNGFELKWTDKVTNEEGSHAMTGNEEVISAYNGRNFTYTAIFNFDGVRVVSEAKLLSTAVYADLNRTGWYAAPETAIPGGAPLANVFHGSAPPAAGTSSGTTITNKAKSPYLSHHLPHVGNSTINNAGADGANNPSAHFDGNSLTYLSMLKGLGTDAMSGAAHVYGGVNYFGVGEKPWFIIRLDAAQAQKFNYFRLRYRENGSNGANLKPQGLVFFGSNDDDCITDDSKWEQINSEIIVPPGCLAASTQPPDADKGQMKPAANLESGNVMFSKICEYKYIKVRYDKWDAAGNTVQLAEFWLGLYD